MSIKTTLSGTPITTLGGINLITLGSASPGPLFDIEFYRARIGLAPTDPSKDDEIKQVLAVSLGMMETYLDRKLIKGDYTEVITHKAGESIQLSAYPIDAIIDVHNLNRKYHVDEPIGLIQFDGSTIRHQIIVDYNGGYDPLPNDLQFVLMQVFDGVWYSVENSSGGSTGTAIDKMVIADVGSISWKVPTDGSASISSPLAAYEYILGNYRRFSA